MAGLRVLCGAALVALVLARGPGALAAEEALGGRTAAHDAAGGWGEGALGEVRRLAEAGVRFDVIDGAGDTPLDVATRHEGGDFSPEVFGFILGWEGEHSPGFAGGRRDRGAYYTGLLEVLLRELRPDLASLRLLLEGGARADGVDDRGTPLVFVHQGLDPLGVLSLLISYGAPVDGFDQRGETLLMRGVNGPGEREGVILLLIGAGAEVNQRNREGKTALMYGRDAGILRLLLDQGADPAIRDEQGKTALHYAAREGDWRTIPLLLGYDIPLDALDNGGLSPLMEAADYRPRYYTENILTLLDWGADPLRRFPNGKTILHRYLEGFEDDWVRRGPSPAVVQRLLNGGIDPGLRDGEGGSALLTALRHEGDRNIDRRAIDLIKGAARREDLAAARPLIRQARREGFDRGKLPVMLPALFVPLAFTGLSVTLREGVYREDPAANWMLPVNGFLALGPGLGAASAFLVGGAVFTITRGDSRGLSTALAFGTAAGIAGFAAGTVLFMLPGVREAVNDYPGLYYLPSILVTTAGGLLFFRVWLK